MPNLDILTKEQRALLLAIANGVHKDRSVLVDDRLLAIFLLHVHAGGQDPNDGHQGEPNDRETDGNLDHRERQQTGWTANNRRAST